MMPTRFLAFSAFGLMLAAGLAGAIEPFALVKTIPFEGKAGNLDHLAVDAKGERLFVANKPNGTLDVIDLKSGKLLKQIPDQVKASGVAFAENLDRVFVGNGSGTCNAFDGKDYTLVFSTKLAKADNVNYHAENKQVYVAHGDTISALDATTGEVKAKISLPGDAHGFAIDAKANKAYVSLTKPSQIGVIDLAKNEVMAKYPLTLAQGNSPLAHDAATGRIFVGCRKMPMVIVLDQKTGKELAGIPIPGDIDDLLFDAKSDRLYAICGAGSVTVIGKSAGDSYQVVGKIETTKSARTATISPDGSHLFLGVPVQEGKSGPEVRIYSLKP